MATTGCIGARRSSSGLARTRKRLRSCCCLHDKYALDGRDPNTYTNVLWCFGLHDRPWSERAIFGQIRYMSYEGMRRKTNVDAYIREIEEVEPVMNVLLTGASGFIGHRLIARLLHEGHSVHAVGRRPPAGFQSIQFSEWKDATQEVPADAIQTSDAIVHLAGEPIAQKWNPEVKARIRDSRVNGTRKLVESIAKLRRRPQTLISASAIGYYGDRGEEVLDETSTPGTGFLPEVCIEWERAAREAGESWVAGCVDADRNRSREGGRRLEANVDSFQARSGRTYRVRKTMDVVDSYRRSGFRDGVRARDTGFSRACQRNRAESSAQSGVHQRPWGSARASGNHSDARIRSETNARRSGAELCSTAKKSCPRYCKRAGFQFRYRDVDDALRSAVRVRREPTSRPCIDLRLLRPPYLLDESRRDSGTAATCPVVR